MKLKIEDQLFNYIKQKTPKKTSLIEELSDVLDISYDAAYRRINNKTALSFEDALKLIRHYKIPIYNLYDFIKNESIFVNKNTQEDIEIYFENINLFIKQFLKHENINILLVLKNIPLFHIPNNTLLAKFNLYTFSNIHSNSLETKNIELNKFTVKPSLIQLLKDYKRFFKKMNITEIWSTTTIDSFLYQIYYFHKAKLIQKNEAIQLCDEITTLVNDIEVKATNELWCSQEHTNYTIYQNKLINLNNILFFSSSKTKAALIPYTSLSEIIIDDKKTCVEIESYLKTQLQFAKKISGDAEIDKRIFFTSMHEKIDQLKHQLKTKTHLSFF
ncbi:hypothetical protein [Tenacibaculum sp. UWU-22]|uniref:hypothetical protein n=1 Tax=Tenacibaculum sp. UWU-22 TaxID=3234187 RepID=UPI0034DB5DB2